MTGGPMCAWRPKGQSRGAAAFSPSDIAGLWWYYKLDEVSGSRADKSSNAFTLTDNNTVTQAVGKVGNAAQFTAANSESLTRADEAGLRIGNNAFTVGAWVYLDSFINNVVISSKGSEWYLNLPAGALGKRPQMALNNDAASLAVWGSDLSLATWYFIVGYWDKAGGKVGIQVNNGTAVETAYVTPPTGTTDAFAVGAFSAAALFIDGRVDEAFGYQALLTAQNKTDLYNGGAGTTIP